jgi:Domain of unknown function (DUF4160)
MPFNLPLPEALSRERWKVKVFEKETVEPPHVTIIKGMEKWRIDLRTMKFMDKKPLSRNVPDELVEHIRANKDVLVKQWNAKYPHNPV